MTGGPEGSGIPLELELELDEALPEEEDELLLELEEELELLEFELLELDELELLDPPPELLLPPHAARAAARINATLDFVRPGRPTDLFKRFINTSHCYVIYPLKRLSPQNSLWIHSRWKA